MGGVSIRYEEVDVSRPKLYIDYDSTLNNLGEVWVKWINQKYHTNIRQEDIAHWDWLEEKFGKDANDFWKDKNIYENDIVKPIDGAVKLVSDLSMKFDVSIVTSSYPGTETSKDVHISKYFGKSNIIHEAQKYKVTGDGVLIDDRRSTIVDHCKMNSKIGIIFTNGDRYTWSKNCCGRHPLMHFAKTYEEIKLLLA